MVIVNLSGGLGNQLYQYAVGRMVAHGLNTELKLDLTNAKISFNPKGHAHYRLGDFNIQENFATPEEVAHVKATGIAAPPFPNFNDCQQDVFISGNAFHSEEAFIAVADIIRREFTLKNPLHKNSAAWEKKILSAENSVAIHVRRDDYIKGTVAHIAGAIPANYYRTCVAELKKFFPNITAFIFSDDLDWARKNLLLDVSTEFITDCESDNEEFYLMSLCKHTVIANSTFSWWAAWLNSNPDKKIFAPQPWTRSGLWNNGISENWTKISVDFEDLPIESTPLLSIVVYIKNNAANLQPLLWGIFNQTFKDYELILIDDGSDDGSEKICRQASLNKKVTLIASGIHMGKAATWNRGFDCARGEYVLFLSSNDLIFQNAVHLLCQIYSWRSRANFIGTIRYLEENPEGDKVIGGIDGKKFSHRIDDQFKNLNAPMVFNNNDRRQKLAWFVMKSVNPLIGTKFFRRDFLQKNSLRFNENIDRDFEFIFAVNAMLLSDEFVFTPDLFYIATGNA